MKKNIYYKKENKTTYFKVYLGGDINPTYIIQSTVTENYKHKTRIQSLKKS